MNLIRIPFAAILIALILLSVPLMGCFGSGEEEEQIVQGNQMGELEDWGVYYTVNTDELPECSDRHTGKLYYISEDSNFVTCSGGLWSEIDVTGEIGPEGPQGPAGVDGADGSNGDQGPQGPPGVDGIDGADGAQGQAGADGVDGTDGLSALVVTTVESADSNCANGGVKIQIGMDYNGDGTMSSAEVDQNVYVCNGADGSNGSDGAQGPQGPQGPAGVDGEDGSDGADGEDGSDGADGTMPVVMEMSVTVSSGKYFIDGIQQGTITLYRGFTYNFDLSSVPASHPFKLGTSANGNQYTSGVSTSGNMMSFTVPLDAPNTLYYYCQNHSNMGGTISINSLGSVS